MTTPLDDGSDCPFRPPPVTYAAYLREVKERHARGDRQTKCAKCRRWRWPDEARRCREGGGGFVPVERRPR